MPRPLLSQITIPDEDFFSSSSTSLASSLQTSPNSSPGTSPHNKSPLSDREDEDSEGEGGLNLQDIPIPFSGAPFVNEGVSLPNESLVPDSERGEYWQESDVAAPRPSIRTSDPASLRRFQDPTEDTEDAEYDQPPQRRADNAQKPARKYASETVVSIAPGLEDISDDEAAEMFPELDNDSDGEDDENPFEWTIVDSDIQEFFQREWSETEMLEQQDTATYLQMMGLEGEDVEAIRWKPNDICEAKLTKESDQWYLARVIKCAKDHTKYKVWFPLLGSHKMEIVTPECMRPSLKQLGAENFHVLEGNFDSNKGFGGFKSVGGSRPQKRT